MVTSSDPADKSPIFIHSLFRSGSTYLFHVFRRSTESYWCYQEPLHEFPLYALDNHDILLSERSDKMELLRHPSLNAPYFLELYEVADWCLDKLNREAIYDSYFAPEGADIGIDYWRALIETAHGRPVIQECRTSSRIRTIKSLLGGFHIYLWRNPWDQWWSHKVADYFDAANQLFINAPRHPEVIDRLRREIGFIGHEGSDLASQFAWFMERQLPSNQNYLIFYVLWCLGLQEGMLNADLLLNIDYLSDSLEYRQEVLDCLSQNSITDLDFSDCSTPQAFYASTDRAFFSRIEDKAHGLFLLSGIPQTDINRLLAIRHEYEPQIWQSPISKIDPSGLLRDAERARALVVKAEGHEVELRSKFRDEISRQERRAEAAEGRAQEQEQRAAAAESRTQEQEQRAVAAESRAPEPEQRAVAAESRAQQAEARRHPTEAALAQSSQELRALQQTNHNHWQLAEERNQYIQALLNSISWRITAPLRSMGRVVIWLRGHAAMSQSTPDVAQSALRQAAVSMINWGVSYAQTSPRFKRFVLRGLNRMPGLAFKLRQMHIESQLPQHVANGGWIGNSGAELAVHGSPLPNNRTNHQALPSVLDGINSRQRTPLEAHFHACGGSE